jgi:hypothetical protein
MKKVLPISNSKFPQKTIAVIAVIMLVAFLFSLKPVAEVVKKGVEMLGFKFPAVEVFQQANVNALYLAAGAFILIVGLAAIVPIVKISLVVVGAALFAYSAYKLYQTFFPSYGDTDLTKK